MKLRINAKVFAIFAIILALIAIGAGIYLTFFQSKGFEKTTAKIVSIKEIPPLSVEDDPDHEVVVEYDVSGTHYTAKLDTYSPSYAVGQSVTVFYDPANPSTIHSGAGFGIYVLIIGGVILVVALGSLIVSRMKVKSLKDSGETVEYAPHEPCEERKLYFLTDQGTPKYGHRIEDGTRRILYEAKVTKFTLTTPTGFEFTDHEHGKVTHHLVGHEDNTTFNSILVDNYSTFSFDGEDVWKHLKKHGVRISSSFGSGNPLFLEYDVYRDDNLVAHIESSGQYVHEEDAEQHKAASKILPIKGFFRITTTEGNLDLLFVVLLALARTSNADGDGGNYGLFTGR